MGKKDSSKTDGGVETPKETTPAPQAAGQAPETPKQETPKEETPPQEAPKPTIMDRAKAMMTDKGSLQQKITTLESANATYATDLATAKQTIATQETELTSLRQFKTELETSVEELEGKQQTVSQGVATELAAIGVEKDDLPGQTKDSEETLEQIQERMKSETDPVEKGKLAAKCRELRWA